MKVVAVRMGYYKNRRVRPGQVIDIPDAMFSDADRKKGTPGWMRKVEDHKRLEAKKAKEQAEHDEVAAPIDHEPTALEKQDIEASKKSRKQDLDVI